MTNKDVRYVKTRTKDSPVKDGPYSVYFAIILEDDNDGHCKIGWLNKKGSDTIGDDLNILFEQKWVGKQHFVPTTREEFIKWSEGKA